MNRLFMLFLTPLFLISCEPAGGYTHGSGWMHHDGTGMMGYGYGWGGEGMLLLLIVVIVAAYIIMRKQGKGSDIFSSARETPLEILKKRYASGEITKEEFDRMKNDIS